MKNDIKWKVSVSCMTYNQSQYISDAMNGFTMQKTNFPFVCTIVDDASTDGEQKVIKDYLENNFDIADKSVSYSQETDYAQILFAQHKENKNCYFAVLFLKENHYSKNKSKHSYLNTWRDRVKYLALCEGDDYWIDSKKLQKQVDILDANNNIVLTHTNFDYFYQVGEYFFQDKNQNAVNEHLSEYQNLLIEEILNFNHYRIQTNTVLFRYSCYLKCSVDIRKIQRMFLMGDTLIWCYLKDMGEFHYLADRTAVYRINQGSATQSTNIIGKTRFHLSCAEMRCFLFDKFHLNNDKLQAKLKSDYMLRLLIYKSFCSDYKEIISIKWNRVLLKKVYYALFNRLTYFLVKRFVNIYVCFKNK